MTSNIDEIVRSKLCSGCGACAYIAPASLVMADEPGAGLRPRSRIGEAGEAGEGDEGDEGDEADAVAVCPGAGLSLTFDATDDGLIHELAPAWGPIYAMWEGYAADDAIRHAGSSGGAASALALYCLEGQGMHGVLHIAAREDKPYLNETVMSHTREELLARTGSRYAPASPCDGLQRVEEAPSPCVFIGKPCDAAAVQKARRLRAKLDEKVGVTIAFFCAGTPSTQGTLEMLKRMGIDNPEGLVSLRYRGNGWPGMATAVVRTAAGEETKQLTYEQSWGEVLAKHQQWRCKVCADHTGEFADIAVGDPWYRPIEPGEAGSSLILARTPRGREIIEGAAAAGYLMMEKVAPDILPKSQPNLLRTRGAVWGRILACRLMGVPAPRYTNMPMFRHWWRELSWSQKARSIGGTMKRILRGRRRDRDLMREAAAQD